MTLDLTPVTKGEEGRLARDLLEVELNKIESSALRYSALDHKGKMKRKEYRETFGERLLREGREEGIDIGHEDGIQKGRREEKVETAERMKAEGFNEKDITKITGLALEEIRSL